MSQRTILAAADVGLAPLDMLGDQHVAVEDPNQMLGRDGLDRFSGEHDRHPIHAQNPPKEISPCLVDPPLHPGQWRQFGHPEGHPQRHCVLLLPRSSTPVSVAPAGP